MITLYKLSNGKYADEPGFNESIDILERIPCEAEGFGFGDGHCDPCIAVKKDGKYGILFFASDYPRIYESDRYPFKYDDIRIYTNGYNDESAFAIVHEGPKCSVIKISPDSTPNIEIVEADCQDRDPFMYIPSSHLAGPSFSPLRYTPSKITKLGKNEIFVFGSNKEGRHGGGAATDAARYFGAQWGVGVGRTGQSYAIPTMDGSLDLIAEYVEGFRCYAVCHPELTFYVTPIGCGIAGWKEEQIAPLFSFAHTMANVILPQGW